MGADEILGIPTIDLLSIFTGVVAFMVLLAVYQAALVKSRWQAG